ncbi:RDD family protein [Microbacterium elymi]|uniref:RDD family protein n=1 Tax=Microbacterium elymi TaxID=2909587 RepID=A0ABY5NJH5_9MICO|nr:RDD family protein [Microbacterium elymi]UUT35303.1 RDD family protein [Microbacterium elymi]
MSVRHPWARFLALLIDWVCILAWVAVTAAVGIPLYLTGAIGPVSPFALNVIAGAVMVVPVTIALAALESTAGHASLGKRVMGLVVVRAGGDAPVRFPRALGRTALKIALPWTLGHAAVIGLSASSASDSVPAPIAVLTAAAYVLPIAYIVSLFLGSGRTPYDRICATKVIAAASGRRTPPRSRR